MKICRFEFKDEVRIGLVVSDSVLLDLSVAGITRLTPLLEEDDVVAKLGALVKSDLPRHALSEVRLLAPVEQQEVWAAGVTYLRSKVARMDESDFSATAYDKVYSADRPEIFFKSIAEKVVPTRGLVGIRKDATWNVPEPELALVLNSKGRVVGYTVGNDMSSRDIEGENLLYLPQAKVYDRSCALGPWIVLGTPEAVAREWNIPVLFIAVEKNRPGHVRDVHNAICAQPSMQGIKMVLYVEHTVPPDDITDVLWRFCNNLDPRRDHFYAGHQNNILGLDGTRKTKELDGFYRDWPNIIVADDPTISSVDTKWEKLGIGAFIPSPSLKFKGQLYGEEAVVNNQ